MGRGCHNCIDHGTTAEPIPLRGQLLGTLEAQQNARIPLRCSNCPSGRARNPTPTTPLNLLANTSARNGANPNTRHVVHWSVPRGWGVSCGALAGLAGARRGRHSEAPRAHRHRPDSGRLKQCPRETASNTQRPPVANPLGRGGPARPRSPLSSSADPRATH
eukprot:6206746-Pyramimonas_sp.AAC.2